MICPMISDTYKCCLEEQCGWYDNENKCCSILQIGKTASRMEEVATGKRMIFTKEMEN